MKINFLILLLTFLALFDISAQSVLPITANISILPPHTTNLSDYIGEGASRTQVILTLNDLNEPYWNTRLRVTIEGNGIKIYTRPDFRPTQPFVIYRDQPNIFSGNELDVFFNNNTTIVEGTARGKIYSNNKLPEGFYNICIEVLDYNTGKLLSNKSCAYVQMQLPNIPILITPRCASVINANVPQQILFSWSPGQSISNIQGTTPEYQLTIYEILNSNTDPAYAIQNNKVLLVFSSDWVKATSYLYSISDPSLDKGKHYVFRVQARYDDTEIQLKNNGYSEPCDFYFGYPVGGSISIISPKDSFTFSRKDPLFFSWNPPTNLLNAQRVSYEYTLKKILPGQRKEDAIEKNETIFSQKTPENISIGKYETQPKITLEAKADYVWQVKAYTDQQLIAESKIHLFHGPALIDKFYAGNHIVYVEETYNSNLNALQGRGHVSLGNGKNQTVDFEQLTLNIVAGNWILTSGDIYQKLNDTSVITLYPKETINSQAYFHPSKLHLNKEGLFLYGYVHWPFSHATTSEETANVYSDKKWFNYDDYTLLGAVNLRLGNQFELLEPFGYTINFLNTSEVSIYKNEYRLNLHGNVFCPITIISTSSSEDKVTLPFKDAEQVHYFTNNFAIPQEGIVPVRNIQLQIRPINYTFDFSEIKSPDKISGNQSWKGIYFDKSDIVFLQNFDLMGQMNFMNDTHYTLEASAADSNMNYLDANGQTFRFYQKFAEGYKIRLNTFPANINDLKIDIRNSVLQNSSINGNMHIPFISTEKKFNFICPLTSTGLNPGYMTDLENYEFVFHPKKEEEKLNIKILRAFFSGQDKLDMTIQVQWPYLGITLENISGFYAWGDYHIGFYTKKGSRYLEQQVMGKITDYDYTVNMIGAGRGAGVYAFGFAGTIVISNDISGSDGAPVLNLYSTTTNNMIPIEEDSWTYHQDSIQASVESGWTSLPEDSAAQRDLIEKQLQKELENSAVNATSIAQNTSLDHYNSNESTGLELPDQTSTSSDNNNNSSNEEIRKGLKAKLSDKEYEVLEQFIDEFIKVGGALITEEIEEYSEKIVHNFNKAIDKPITTATTYVDKEVHTIVDTITIKVARMIMKEDYDPSPVLMFIADTISDELAHEVNRSITTSINNNLRQPVTRFIKAQMVDSVHAFIAERFKGMIHELMSGETNIGTFTTDLAKEIPSFMLRSGENIVQFVSPDHISRIIKKTTLDAIRGIDLVRVGDRLSGGLLRNGKEIVTRTLENTAEDKINGIIQSVFANTPVLNAVAPPGVQMNFNNLGEKIKEGKINEIITLDPTNIAVNTRFVSFAGSLRHIKDDVYGNAWRGAFLATIKQPKPFGVDVIFISGKTNNNEFWFAQVSPSNGTGKTGGQLDKTPKEFSRPASIGPVQIIAGTGRIYKHMREIRQGYDIVPDPSVNYGAYFNLVMFDEKNKGKTVRLGVEAEYILNENQSFMIDFTGDAQIINKEVSKEKADPHALVNGSIHLYYNSTDEHLLAEGDVSIFRDNVICGQGNFLLETKPGYWRLGVGNKNRPVKVVPLCKGWGALGWLLVDQREVEVGVGIGYYVYTEAAIDLGKLKAGIGVDAGVELKAWAAVQYNPDLKLNRVGIQAVGWVHIFVFYETKMASGSINLVDVEIGLEGEIKINPKPSNVNGRVWGHIKILIFGVDFETTFKKNT